MSVVRALLVPVTMVCVSLTTLAAAAADDPAAASAPVPRIAPAVPDVQGTSAGAGHDAPAPSASATPSPEDAELQRLGELARTAKGLEQADIEKKIEAIKRRREDLPSRIAAARARGDAALQATLQAALDAQKAAPPAPAVKEARPAPAGSGDTGEKGGGR